MYRLACYALLAAALHADVPTAVTAAFSSTPASPGGTAQIILTLPTPLRLVAGDVSLDLDPAVFDNISAVNVFSASGDQVGTANILGRHADVQFTSDSGGIGRLAALPVLQVTVPVLASAKLGTAGAVSAKSISLWRDIAGGQYAMSFAASAIPIANGPSIQSVTPGSGPLPAGTRIQIDGQGFTAAMRLQVDGVDWSGFQFVNAQQAVFTLDSPADLAGRLVTLTGAGGARTRYYSALTPTSVRRAASVPATVQPIFSNVTLPRPAVDFTEPFALENPGLNPVNVVIETPLIPLPHQPAPPPNSVTIVIPPGGVYIADSHDVPPGNLSPDMMLSSALRVVKLCCWFYRSYSAQPVAGVVPVAGISYAQQGDPLTFNWRPGDPLPAPLSM
jgi:hypothetical protein